MMDPTVTVGAFSFIGACTIVVTKMEFKLIYSNKERFFSLYHT
jgi:hypothetical protein